MPFIKGVYYVYLTQYIKRFREKLSDENLTLEDLFYGLHGIGIDHAIIDGNESNLYLDSDLMYALQNRIHSLESEIEKHRKDCLNKAQTVQKTSSTPIKTKPLTQSQIAQKAREDMFYKHTADAKNAENERINAARERMKKLSDLYLASDGVFGKPYGDPYDDLDESMKTKKFRRW